MKERLTKLIKEAQERYIYAEEQAQYLVENGVIVPPCKVGDILYVIYKWHNEKVYPVKVSAIRMDTKKNSNRICVWGSFHITESYAHEYKATFKFDNLGKTVFLTRKEAERALKGGESDG